MTILGQGNFSKVFRVRSKFDGMEYAIKRSFRAVTSDVEAKQWQQVHSKIFNASIHLAYYVLMHGHAFSVLGVAAKRICCSNSYQLPL